MTQLKKMKIFKSILSSFIELTFESDNFKYPLPFYCIILSIFYLQMFGYVFPVESLKDIQNPYAFYLIKIFKSANFLYLFEESILLIYVYFIFELLLMFEYVFLIFFGSLKLLKDRIYAKVFSNHKWIIRLRDLYYRCFLWLLFVPLIDLNLNFIICSSNILVNHSICNNIFFLIFGILGVCFTIFQAFQIILFYLKTNFENENLSKRNSNIIYILESIIKVFVILFYQMGNSQNLYYFFSLNLLAILNFLLSIFGFPFSNMKMCILNLFFSLIFIFLAFLRTLNNYFNLIGLTSICFATTIIAPFFFTLGKIIYDNKLSSIYSLYIHQPNIPIPQLIVYSEQLISLYKAKSLEQKMFLNGLFSLHVTRCSDKNCRLFQREGSEDFIEEFCEILENWLLLIFNSLEKKTRLAETKENEILLLCYCDFIKQNLQKLSFSLYVLKSHRFRRKKKSTEKGSYFFKEFSKLYEEKIQSILLRETKKYGVDHNLHNIKIFIAYESTFSQYISSFKAALEMKQNIYKSLLNGYKTFDSFFEDSLKFLIFLKNFERKFLFDILQQKKSILFLKLKSIFSLFILNDVLEFQKLEHQISEVKSIEITKRNFVDSLDFVSGDLILLNASVLGETGSMQKNSHSQKLAEFFGYNITEFQSIENVDRLMPKILADNHFLFIKKYFNNRYTGSEKIKVRSTFIMKKNLYIYPVHIYLTYNFSLKFKDDLYFTAAIKLNKNYDNYAVCRENGKISAVSEEFLADYSSTDWRTYYEKINIFFLFPDIFKTIENCKLENPVENVITILKNEVIQFYCPKNFSIFKLILLKEQEFITQNSLNDFFSLNSDFFRKEYLLLSVNLETFYFLEGKQLKILVFTLHNFEGKDLLSFYSKSMKSSTKNLPLIKNDNFENEEEKIPLESPPFLGERMDLKKNEEENSGELLHTGLKPKYDPIQIMRKEPSKSEILSEKINFNSILNIDIDYGRNTPPESPSLNAPFHETTENFVHNTMAAEKIKQSTENFSDPKEQITSSLHSSIKEEFHYGANLVKTLGNSKKYPKAIKKICFILIFQIILFFFLNIISYIMINNELQNFIEYSQKMKVPDEVAISYNYIIATQNILLLIEKNYLNYNKVVLRDLTIELEGHCFRHLLEFLNLMKEPSFNGQFEEEMKVYYFIENLKIIQNEKFREFLMSSNLYLNKQISHPHEFFHEIFNFFINNFRSVIEMCSSYSRSFLSKAIMIKEQQSEFYFMMSLIGLFMSLFLIMINFPFLNEYFIVLEKILIVVAQLKENECQSIIEQNKKFFSILDDPSQKFLSQSLEKNYEDPKNTALKLELSKDKTKDLKKSDTKKKILSKFTSPKLSRKSLVLLNMLLLIVTSMFYAIVFLLKNDFVSNMELSIEINSYYSDYLQSCNLVYASELLFFSANYFSLNKTGNEYQVLKIESDKQFYQNQYLENISKLEKFLGKLIFLTDNADISSINPHILRMIKEAFFNDVCNTIDEEACEEKLENNFQFGLNGFWYDYLKFTRENKDILLNFTSNHSEFLISTYSNELMYERLIDLHISDHKNMDLLDYKTTLQINIYEKLIDYIALIFLVGSGCCTFLLFIVNFWMFLKVKNTILNFRKILFLIPMFKLKEESIVYLLKKIDEF